MSGDDESRKQREGIEPDISPNLPGDHRGDEGGARRGELNDAEEHPQEPQNDSSSEGQGGSSGDDKQGEDPNKKGFFRRGGASSDNSEDDDNSEGFYNRYKDKKSKTATLFGRNQRKKWALIISSMAALLSLVGGFGGLATLNLANFMANIEKKGFARYQVDLNGRSSKWIVAYAALRFGEVNDPKLAPRDRDNILFRSDRVDHNRPLTDWYKTMRASKFEKEVFEKHGIKFTSVAYRDGNIIKFRPGHITVNGDKKVTFDPKTLGYNELDALSEGKVNDLNGRMREFVEVKVYDSDKEGRAALRQLIREEKPGWYRAAKRYALRRDISNMIGVRRWSFFENTRRDVRENIAKRRNKVVQKFVDRALPADGKSGKFVECLFGLGSCSGGTDTANPDNQLNPSGAQDTSEAKTETGPDGKPVVDANGNPVQLGDGTGEATARAASDGASTAGKSVAEALPKVLKAVSVAALIDMVAKFDRAVHDHKLSKVVTQAKTQYAVGVYTTLETANAQHKTGKLSSQEFSDFMSQYGNLSNSDAQTTVINPKKGGATASAASTSYVDAKNKKEFCSEEHQAEMAKPENKKAAEAEHQYLCDKDVIGGKTRASAFEAGWNSGPGAILHPFLAAYESALGGIFDVFNAVIGKVVGALLTVTGTKGTVESVAKWGAAKAINFAGANMDIGNAPSGRVGNIALEGAGAAGEASMRDQGAAETTPATALLATKNYLAYQAEETKTSSFSERYFALSNPSSLASKGLPFLANLNTFHIGFSNIGSIFSTIASPLNSLTLSTGAASKQPSNDDGYAAARFAQIDTYDFPKECLDPSPLDMTPANSTNADEMAIFTVDELNWDTMQDKQAWGKALYDKIGSVYGKDKSEEIAVKVYNCALLDDTVKGNIGSPYGYKSVNAFANNGEKAAPKAEPDTSTGNLPTGDAQSLAKQIIDAGNITGNTAYIAQIKAIADGSVTCNVNPQILQMLVGVTVQDKHTIELTSLNRFCTGLLTKSGKKSFHYADGGGHAIDIDKYDGAAVDGASAATLKYLKEASQYLPKNTGYGQVDDCHSGFSIPSGSYNVPDQCNHQHIEVPPKKIGK